MAYSINDAFREIQATDCAEQVEELFMRLFDLPCVRVLIEVAADAVGIGVAWKGKKLAAEMNQRVNAGIVMPLTVAFLAGQLYEQRRNNENLKTQKVQ